MIKSQCTECLIHPVKLDIIIQTKKFICTTNIESTIKRRLRSFSQGYIFVHFFISSFTLSKNMKKKLCIRIVTWRAGWRFRDFRLSWVMSDPMMCDVIRLGWSKNRILSGLLNDKRRFHTAVIYLIVNKDVLFPNRVSRRFKFSRITSFPSPSSSLSTANLKGELSLDH